MYMNILLVCQSYSIKTTVLIHLHNACCVCSWELSFWEDSSTPTLIMSLPLVLNFKYCYGICTSFNSLSQFSSLCN